MSRILTHLRLSVAASVIFAVVFAFLSLDDPGQGFPNPNLRAVQAQSSGAITLDQARKMVEECLGRPAIDADFRGCLSRETINGFGVDLRDDRAAAVFEAGADFVAELTTGRADFVEFWRRRAAHRYQRRLSSLLNADTITDEQRREAEVLGDGLLRVSGHLSESTAASMAFLNGLATSSAVNRAASKDFLDEADFEYMQKVVFNATEPSDAAGHAIEMSTILFGRGHLDEAFRLLIETAEFIDDRAASAKLYRVASSLAGGAQECAAAREFWDRAAAQDGSAMAFLGSSGCQKSGQSGQFNLFPPPGDETDLIAALGESKYFGCINTYQSRKDVGWTENRANAAVASCFLTQSGFAAFPESLSVLAEARRRAEGIDIYVVSLAWALTGSELRQVGKPANASIAYEQAAKIAETLNPKEIWQSVKGTTRFGFCGQPPSVQGALPGEISRLSAPSRLYVVLRGSEGALESGQPLRAISLHERGGELLTSLVSGGTLSSETALDAAAATVRYSFDDPQQAPPSESDDPTEDILEDAIRHDERAWKIAAETLHANNMAGESLLKSLEAAAMQDRYLGPLAGDDLGDQLAVNGLTTQVDKLEEFIKIYPPGLDAASAIQRAAEIAKSLRDSSEGGAGYFYHDLISVWNNLARLAQNELDNPLMAEELYGKAGDAHLDTDDPGQPNYRAASVDYRLAGQQAEAAGSCERAELWYRLEADTINLTGANRTLRTCSKDLVPYGDGFSFLIIEILKQAGIEPESQPIAPASAPAGAGSPEKTGSAAELAAANLPDTSGAAGTGDLGAPVDRPVKPQDAEPDLGDRIIEELGPAPEGGGGCNALPGGTAAAGHAALLAMPLALLGFTLMRRRRS